MSDICKFYKEEKEVSYDGGTTWIHTGEYRKGDLVEYKSPDCDDCETSRIDATYFTTEDDMFVYFTYYRTCDHYGCLDLPNTVIDGYRVGTAIPAYPYKFKNAGDHYVTMYLAGYKGQVPNSLFYDLRGLKKLNISDCVTDIGNDVCKNCLNLTDVILSKNTEFIGANAFESCISLTGFTFGEKPCDISECMFKDCVSLPSIVIPDNITWIGNYAFDMTKNGVYTTATTVFSSCTIGNGVTEISCGAFLNCDKLEKLIIGNSVELIGEWAFSGCTSLSSVTIPNSTTIIKDRAFANCSGLTYIEIGSGVTTIEYSAFAGCSSLQTINIPNSVTYIGEHAFNGCTSLPEDGCCVRYADTYLAEAADKTRYNYQIGHRTRWIGEDAFNACTNLAYIDIPDSVECIGNGAFMNCLNLRLCTIGNGVTTIRSNAFNNCQNLPSIVIPDSVEYIGDWSFYNCSGLTNVTIGSGVTSVGDYVFSGCTSLPVDDFDVRYADTYLVEAVDKTQYGYPIKDTTKWIGEYAFSGCTNFNYLYIPDNVIDIKKGAFYRCRGVTNCTIGSGVTSIGEYAFTSCSGLTSVNIPDSVTTIGSMAFDDCTSLTNITIGSGVTFIDQYAFSDGPTDSMRTVIINATTPPVLGGVDVFRTRFGSLTIFVPSQSVEAYKTADMWDWYADVIQPIP